MNIVKKYFLLALIFMSFTLIVHAQPSAVQRTTKAVFTLNTYNADGSLLASTHGFFIHNDGTAISQWSPFVGAARAEAIDADGRKHAVECICGANELYNLAKFRVSGQVTTAKLADESKSSGTQAWVIGSTDRKTETQKANIVSTEKFMDKYTYYIVGALSGDMSGCPMVNSTGEVMALVQQSKTGADYHATSARFAADLRAPALSSNDPTLRQTAIRIDLPEDHQEALLSLLLAASQSDSTKYAETIEAFIKKFPNAPDGYYSRAEAETNAARFTDAARDMEKAISCAERKDEAHFSYARLIYRKELYMTDYPFSEWSLDKARQEAQQAYNINPLPVYRHLMAQIDYSQGNTQQALDVFTELTHTPLRNAELYYEIAQCRQRLGAPQAQIIEMLDSAISICKDNEAASYYLARAVLFDEAGEYRRAVQDYNRYDTLLVLSGQLPSPQFYYQREQCELNGKLYQQALEDISRAVVLAPSEPLYLAEKASLLLRVNRKEEALTAARQCVAIAPQYAEARLLLGIALVQNNQKKDGLAELQKAMELGNEQAKSLIEKYK